MVLDQEHGSLASMSAGMQDELDQVNKLIFVQAYEEASQLLDRMLGSHEGQDCILSRQVTILPYLPDIDR